MVDNTDICQVILYNCNSFHMLEEIKEMECLLFPTDFEKQWQDLSSQIKTIVEMWDPLGGGINPKFFCNKKVWRKFV
jgi:hypothetical protein